jgi:hypothetical protein
LLLNVKQIAAARIAASNSINAVNFSSARTTKRFPSPRCASAIQIVRPWNQSLTEIAQVHGCFSWHSFWKAGSLRKGPGLDRV